MFYLLLAAIIYGIYKFYKTKNESIFYGLFFVATLQLVRYPFYLPLEISMSMWSFFGCTVLSYKIMRKKMERSLFAFPIVFFALGLVFLLLRLQ